MGPAVVQAVRRATKLPLDVHLMVEAPERFVAEFARAGADFLTVHVEASKHLHRTVQQIRELGVRPGVTLNPATALETLWEILPYVHMVLVMTVNPGFGGQGFIPTMNDKVARLAAMIRERNPEVEIEVDGGIDAETVPGVVRAGAKVLVAGTAVFKHPAGIAGGIADLRRAAGSAASGGVPAKVAAS
jgi:ribulose-phosphate 3-epimerase